MEQKKAATIEDVALLAGVSIATVSRAIHHPNKVAEATRGKVRKAIAATGFTANAMAQNLRRKSSRMILAVVPDIGNSFFSNILMGLEAVASERGYGLLIANLESNAELETGYLDFIRSNKADGLVMLAGQLPFQEPGYARGLPPLVTVCERVEQRGLPFIGIDNVHAAQLAVQHLLELGHRRIAHVAGPMENILSQDRRSGWERAIAEAGLEADPSLVISGDFSLESGRRIARQLLSLDERPSAYFCASDEMAIGVLMELSQRGCQVPDDISVIGFDDIQFARCTAPPLTTIRQPRSLIGEQAMTVMLNLIEHGAAPKEPVILPVELVVRGSTGPAPR